MRKTILAFNWASAALVVCGISGCAHKPIPSYALSFNDCIERQPIMSAAKTQTTSLERAYSDNVYLFTFRQKGNQTSKIIFDVSSDRVEVADDIGTPAYTDHTFTIASLNEDSYVNQALTPRVASIIGALEACRLKNDSLK